MDLTKREIVSTDGATLRPDPRTDYPFIMQARKAVGWSIALELTDGFLGDWRPDMLTMFHVVSSVDAMTMELPSCAELVPRHLAFPNLVFHPETMIIVNRAVPNKQPTDRYELDLYDPYPPFNVHPGVYVRWRLKVGFPYFPPSSEKKPYRLGPTTAEVAKWLNIGRPAASRFLSGKAACTPKMALALEEKEAGFHARVLMRKQAEFDLEMERSRSEKWKVKKQ